MLAPCPQHPRLGRAAPAGQLHIDLARRVCGLVLPEYMDEWIKTRLADPEWMAVREARRKVRERERERESE